MNLITIVTSKSFFGSHYVNKETTNVPLTRENCRVMVETKHCNTELMQCDEENCFYDKELAVQFEWMRSTTQTIIVLLLLKL